MFSATLMVLASPSLRRSIGMCPMPSRTAWLGEPPGSRLPSSDTLPLSGRSCPVMQRQTASLPEPTRPTRLTISPRRTAKLSGSKAPFRPRSRTSSTTSSPGSTWSDSQ